MKKNDARLDDAHVTHGSGNVFIDCGFEPAEAHVMLMRSNLMNEIEKYLTTQNWTEAEAAKRLGITQARVAKLKRGMSREFTIEMLVLFAARLGLEPELRLAA